MCAELQADNRRPMLARLICAQGEWQYVDRIKVYIASRKNKGAENRSGGPFEIVLRVFLRSARVALRLVRPRICAEMA